MPLLLKSPKHYKWLAHTHHILKEGKPQAWAQLSQAKCSQNPVPDIIQTHSTDSKDNGRNSRASERWRREMAGQQEEHDLLPRCL